MEKFNFKCNVNEHEILEAIKNHDCYDSWGDVMYGNSRQAVEYNICVDNSTDKTEYLSAFYRLSKDKVTPASFVMYIMMQNKTKI